MPVMVERKKWILYRHTWKYELIKAIALDLKNNCKSQISDKEKYRIQERLQALSLYKMRNKDEKPLDSINHRINTLEYWMFGYEEETSDGKRFMFSPLGNLFLNNIKDESKLRKIFISMLFALQYEHPGSRTDKCFQIYPFRLIFKLLLDARLDYKLYNNEVEYLIVFIDSIDDESYEKLVEDILSLRTKSNDEMKVLFKKDEHAFVNTVYEWEYYTQKLLNNIGILDIKEGDFICKLFHPSKANSKSAPTGRNAKRGYVKLNKDVIDFVELLLNKYKFTDKPLRLDDPERLEIDVIKEIYSFYPKELLVEIGELEDEIQVKLLELPKLIEEYSNNPQNKTAYLFEDVLVDGFNMFYNVDARGIGGSGKTDIECLYKSETRNKKFAVDAKSTKYKLANLNAGRLRNHRENIGGEYTIVITPRYVPAVLKDIKDTPIVIICASTFSEYLYNHINNGIREIDYDEIDKLVTNNLGKDISKELSYINLEKFAASN